MNSLPFGASLVPYCHLTVKGCHCRQHQQIWVTDLSLNLKEWFKGTQTTNILASPPPILNYIWTDCPIRSNPYSLTHVVVFPLVILCHGVKYLERPSYVHLQRLREFKSTAAYFLYFSFFQLHQFNISCVANTKRTTKFPLMKLCKMVNDLNLYSSFL